MFKNPPLYPFLSHINPVHILTRLPVPFALILAERCKVNLGVKNTKQTKKVNNTSHRSNTNASSDVSYSPNPNPVAVSPLGTQKETALSWPQNGGVNPTKREVTNFSAL